MHRLSRVTVPLCLLGTLFLASCAVARACFRQILNYNEGWNIYNAVAFGNHQQLYPAGAHWTTNNYPMLSFVLMSGLHRVTGEYLFTGRAVALLSTVLLCVLVSVLAKELGADRHSAILAGMFCFCLFCVDTAHDRAQADYINAADPEMLGLALFMVAVVLYVLSKRRDSLWFVLASAFTVALASSVKHSSVSLLLAILIDSCWSPRKRLAPFLLTLGPLVLLSVYLQVQYGGPGFLQNLLERRTFDEGRALILFGLIFLPICVTLACVLAYAFLRCRRGPRRFALILLLSTTGVGFYFGSSAGVSVNCFFELMVALCVTLGLCLADIRVLAALGTEYKWTSLTPFALFLSLTLPAYLNYDLQPYAAWLKSNEAQKKLDHQVAFIAGRPGPALCEDLLLCHLAGKPYVYDPFNATRLVRIGRLNEGEIVRRIQQAGYSSIQLRQDDMNMYAAHQQSERFSRGILSAVLERYTVGDKVDDALIYIPK